MFTSNITRASVYDCRWMFIIRSQSRLCATAAYGCCRGSDLFRAPVSHRCEKPSQYICFIYGPSNQCYVYNQAVFLDGFGQRGQPPLYQHFTWCLGGQSSLSGQCVSYRPMRSHWVCDGVKHPGLPLKSQVNSL